MASSTEPWGAPGSLVFVSDVHLDDSFPDRSLLFSSFLSRISRPPRPAALYVLGDLFDVWLGRYSLRAKAHAQVLREFLELTRAGVEVCVVSGNRDFLLDGNFGEKTGAAVVEEWLSIRLGSRRAFLCHGDRLAIEDRSHQRLRWVLRSRPARLLASALPERAVQGVARWLRRQSEAARARGPFCLPGISPLEVARIFRGGYDLVIAGHVHEERRRIMVVDGHARQLYTLGAWEHGGSFLVFDGKALKFEKVES